MEYIIYLVVFHFQKYASQIGSCPQVIAWLEATPVKRSDLNPGWVMNVYGIEQGGPQKPVIR